MIIVPIVLIVLNFWNINCFVWPHVNAAMRFYTFFIILYGIKMLTQPHVNVAGF